MTASLERGSCRLSVKSFGKWVVANEIIIRLWIITEWIISWIELCKNLPIKLSDNDKHKPRYITKKN